jgi:tetratricopeptide (TPR) repeat protein
MLGRQLARSGRPQPALAEFREALNGNPGCGLCYGSIALVELHLGRLEVAMGIRPSFADRLLLGATYTELGRMDEAISLFRRLVAEQPDSGVARLGLGRALLRAGRPREALEHLERAEALGQPAAFGLVERARRQVAAESPSKRGLPSDS